MDRFFRFECVRMDGSYAFSRASVTMLLSASMNTYDKANHVGMQYETLTSSMFSLPTLAASSSASDVMIARRFI